VRISIWKLLGLLLTLLLLAFILWGFSRIEYVERTVHTGFQGAAARNPLLAIGRLAERYGATTHTIPAYSKPPQSGATLVFAASRHWLSSEQNEALLDWVRTTGGHLIISPQQLQRMGRKDDAIPQDPLLDSLRISVKYLDEKQSPEAEKAPEEVLNAFLELLHYINKLETRTIELPDGVHLRAGFDSRVQLEYHLDSENDGNWHISDPSANNARYALSQVFGKGRITVLTNLDFIDNYKIGENDHAALFVYLTSLAKGQDIWFVYGTDVPALWRWAVDHAWAVLIAAALLLIIWLWAISRRFGPLLPARSVDRRSIVEHVAASARYLWRCKQGQALYRILCNDFYKRAWLRHPHWSRLPVQELNQQIVLFAHETRIPQLSGLTEQAVGYLLDTRHFRDEKRFAADSLLLDILRNQL